MNGYLFESVLRFSRTGGWTIGSHPGCSVFACYTALASSEKDETAVRGCIYWLFPNYYQERSQHFFKREGGGLQITKSCLVSDKYHSEVALKIDTVKDQGVRGGLRNPGTHPSSCVPDYSYWFTDELIFTFHFILVYKCWKGKTETKEKRVKLRGKDNIKEESEIIRERVAVKGKEWD